MGQKSKRTGYRAAHWFQYFFSNTILRTSLLLPMLMLLPPRMGAATLTASLSPVPTGANINLTAEGKLDWVHWGLSNDTCVNRKATVVPQINDFLVYYDTNLTYAAAYRYDDNYNGYSWSDGTQDSAVTNTITGVYVGVYSPQENNGFQLTVPADTTLKTLKVYVGAFAARGRFQATLSDSATTFSSTALANSGNGPGGVYTIQFAANSTNQTLTILWVLYNRMGANGNVTLQAATLTAAGVNNPTYARITQPGPNENFAAPANITMSADAFDPDGTINKVEFFRDEIKVGEAVSQPYSITMTNLPPGPYRLTARPSDNAGASSVSSPTEIFVHGTGGTLNGSRSVSPGAVDLTAEGNIDWMHWGLNVASDLNRKNSILTHISGFSQTGTNLLARYTDHPTACSWSNGTPTVAANNSSTGVFLTGMTNGFQFSVPADPDLRTLKVYVGLYGGSGNFQAWLSDGSAAAFTDRSLSNGWNSAFAVYTLDYASASSGQSLHVKYSNGYLFDQDYGNVSLAAVTLSGAVPAVMFNAVVDSGSFTFHFGTDLGRTYSVQYCDTMPGSVWTTLTTVTGSGAPETVTDAGSHPHRFYRIESQ